MLRTGLLAGALALGAGVAPAQDAVTVPGHEIRVDSDWAGGASLVVDGFVLLQDGVITLDPEPLTIAGVRVVTGAAGAGGNACNAAPFVLALPETGPPELSGPVDSCAHLVPEAQGERLLFVSEATATVGGRLRPDEVWIWTPEVGFGAGPAFGAAELARPAPGWERLDQLTDAHPAEAMKLTPVVEALRDGLGTEFPAFADRILGLGAGGATATGYTGRACLKTTCAADWAILILHGETRGVFAIWHVAGEVEPRIWPGDTTLWPDVAMAVLRSAGSEGQ